MTDTSTERLLAFEREWMNRPQHDGAKVQAARERFGLSDIGYYQQLRVALCDPSAVEAHPLAARFAQQKVDRFRRSRAGGR